MNMPAQLSTLQQEISALTRQLAPASEDEIVLVLNGLMDGGMLFPASIRAKDKIGEYHKAMADCPSVGLRKAAIKLKRGEYDNINLAFIPLPAKLAAMARAEARSEREDRARLRERVKAIEEQESKPAPRDPNVIARIRAKHQAFKQDHAAAKAISEIPPQPISAEKAEYYSKIMALNDAPGGPDAEQSAFRRKIAGDISKAIPEMKDAAE